MNSSSKWRIVCGNLSSSRSFGTIRHPGHLRPRGPALSGNLLFSKASCWAFRLARPSPGPIHAGWTQQHRRGLAAAVDSSSPVDLSSFYQIEANNAARAGATMLTVSGPDIDGILASMTVALALKGCSLVELHAAKTDNTHHQHQDHNQSIHDTFYVVDRNSGLPFPDEDLEDLAKSLLEALKTPMNIINVGGAVSNLEECGSPSKDQPQITVVPSGDAPRN